MLVGALSVSFWFTFGVCRLIHNPLGDLVQVWFLSLVVPLLDILAFVVGSAHR